MSRLICAVGVLVFAGCNFSAPEELEPNDRFEAFKLAQVQLPEVGRPLQPTEVIDGRVAGGAACLGEDPGDLGVTDADRAPVIAAYKAAGFEVETADTVIIARRGSWSVSGSVVRTPVEGCGLGWLWAATKPVR